MRLAVLFVALAASGCATVGAPAIPDPPGTLAEVNALLEGRQAQVFLDDGTFVRGVARVGADETVVLGRFETEVVPTARVRSIDVDVSRTARQGGRSGLVAGVTPALLLAALDFGASVRCLAGRGGICSLDPLARARLALPAGAALGYVVGRARAAKVYPATVYLGPVTRYPDAATIPDGSLSSRP